MLWCLLDKIKRTAFSVEVIACQPLAHCISRLIGSNGEPASGRGGGGSEGEGDGGSDDDKQGERGFQTEHIESREGLIRWNIYTKTWEPEGWELVEKSRQGASSLYAHHIPPQRSLACPIP